MKKTGALQQNARDQFRANGYYHAVSVFSETEIKRLEVDFDFIVEQLAGSCESINARCNDSATGRSMEANDTVVHAHNVQKYSRHWLDAMLNDRFLDLACAFLGENVILHHSTLFQKPARHGSRFPIHQDWHCFPGKQNRMVTGVIHVSKATEDMGCLRVWPASHRLGRLSAATGGNGGHTLADYPMEGASPIEAMPGDVVFFHCLTLHGSRSNRSPHPRKSVLVQMYAGEEKIEEGHCNGHDNEKLVLRGHNIHIWHNGAAATRQGRAK